MGTAASARPWPATGGGDGAKCLGGSQLRFLPETARAALPTELFIYCGKSIEDLGAGGEQSRAGVQHIPTGKARSRSPCTRLKLVAGGEQGCVVGWLQRLCPGLPRPGLEEGQRLTARMPELHPVLGHVSFPRRCRPLGYVLSPRSP